MSSSRWPHPALLVATMLVLSGSASAQSVLLAQYENKAHVVRGVTRQRPYIEIDGKRVLVSGSRYALHKVDEFVPVFVSVSRVQARTVALNIAGTGNTINNRFEFSAQFSSVYPLENVFVVLELMTENGPPSLFIYEIGNLSRDHPRKLDLVMPTAFPLGEGKFKLHVFVEGREVLHSKIPFNQREQALDKIVAKRVAGRADGPPAPLVGPPPEYPEKLEKSKTKGEVLIQMRIRRNGAVLDPVIVSASDPAFGEAALESIRQWRFLPQMENGKPVEASVTLPINFTPPVEAG